MSRQTTITIETTSLLVIQSRSSRGWCPECSAETDLISLDALPESPGLAPVALQAVLSAHAVHRTLDHGKTMLCLKSLLACATAHPPGRVLPSTGLGPEIPKLPHKKENL